MKTKKHKINKPISESELLKAIKAGRKEYKIGKTIKANSLLDFLVIF